MGRVMLLNQLIVVSQRPKRSCLYAITVIANKEKVWTPVIFEGFKPPLKLQKFFERGVYL